MVKLLVLLLTLFSVALGAQAPDSLDVRMSLRFKWVFDSLSMESKHQWVEQALCVGKWEKDGSTLTLSNPIAPAIVYADSVTVKYERNNFCGGGCPVIHWHLLEWPSKRTPSWLDLNTSIVYSWAPFQILGIGGTPDMVLYNVRKMPSRVSFESTCQPDST